MTDRIRSLEAPFDAVVIGASGGIGSALVAALAADPSVNRILAFSRSAAANGGAKVGGGLLDLLDEGSIASAANEAATLPRLRLVVVATGFLHGRGAMPERSLRELDPQALARAFAINAIGPAIVLKHFLPLLPRSGKSVMAALSARVGSIGDNRLGGWYGYRASKAALNQLLRTAAIEFARTHREGIVLGLHPGTVATAMSQPFTAGYSAKPVFTPDYSAAKLLEVIDSANVGASGTVIDWRHEPVTP